MTSDLWDAGQAGSSQAKVGCPTGSDNQGSQGATPEARVVPLCTLLGHAALCCQIQRV